MSEREEYAPSMDEILGQWVADAFRDCHRRPDETEHLPIGALRDAADRAIAAHEKALREEVAKEIEHKREALSEAQLRSLGHLPPVQSGIVAGYTYAARIARGEDQTDE